MEKKVITRNITWDYARGIAIVMIVFHHLYARFYINPDFYPNSIIYLICYTCQLPIFMYISGLFANNSIKKYGVVDLLKNRAVRLILPFFSFMIIWTIIKPERFPSAFIENFKDGYWFVYVLFEMMAILSISKWLAEIMKTNTVFIIIILYVILTILKFTIQESNFFNGLFSLNLLWHYFPFFIMGYYSNKIDWIFQKRYALISALVYSVSIIYLQQSKSHAIIPLCNISSLILAITLFTKGIRPFEHIFSIIGINSMQIYLLHFFSSLFIIYINPLDSPIEEFLFDIILTTLLITTCIIAAKIIMRYNLLTVFLFGINRRQEIISREKNHK